MTKPQIDQPRGPGLCFVVSGSCVLTHLNGARQLGFHTETSELVTPKDKSGLAEDHVGAGRRTG